MKGDMKPRRSLLESCQLLVEVGDEIARFRLGVNRRVLGFGRKICWLNQYLDSSTLGKLLAILRYGLDERVLRSRFSLVGCRL